MVRLEPVYISGTIVPGVIICCYNKADPSNLNVSKTALSSTTNTDIANFNGCERGQWNANSNHGQPTRSADLEIGQQAKSNAFNTQLMPTRPCCQHVT